MIQDSMLSLARASGAGGADPNMQLGGTGSLEEH